MTEIVCTVLTVTSGIIIAIINARMTKLAKDIDERAERRKIESELSLELMMANIDLAEVSANALTGGHNNGNVEAARKKVATARENYNKFLQRVMAEELA